MEDESIRLKNILIIQCVFKSLASPCETCARRELVCGSEDKVYASTKSGNCGFKVDPELAEETPNAVPIVPLTEIIFPERPHRNSSQRDHHYFGDGKPIYEVLY
jgi:hypothetical protein